MFTYLSIRFTPNVYLDNMWPRVLGPMFTLGCLLFTWNRIHSFSPKVSYLFLLSPVTYCVEELRHAVFLPTPNTFHCPYVWEWLASFVFLLLSFLKAHYVNDLTLLRSMQEVSNDTAMSEYMCTGANHSCA